MQQLTHSFGVAAIGSANKHLGRRWLSANISTNTAEQHCDSKLNPTLHRSHSPNTTSIAPRIAVASGSIWPFDMKSIA